jgi:anti-sigma regulatory factor (Ser/Thr protein kinase)
MCRVVMKHFDGRDPTTPAKARRWLSDRLDLWEVSKSVDTAELLISELVTNAIRHGGGSPILTVSLAHDWLEVGVADSDSSHLPTPSDGQAADRLPLDLTAEGGRGLGIVDALAAEWGTTVTERGKEVWFRLDADGWPHVSDCQCDDQEGTLLASGTTVHAIPGPWDL